MQTQKKTEHGWFLSILTIFQNEVFETILKFIVDEEVVDKPLLLGGCLGLHHDGEGGAVVLGEEMLSFVLIFLYKFVHWISHLVLGKAKLAPVEVVAVPVEGLQPGVHLGHPAHLLLLFLRDGSQKGVLLGTDLPWRT